MGESDNDSWSVVDDADSLGDRSPMAPGVVHRGIEGNCGTFQDFPVETLLQKLRYFSSFTVTCDTDGCCVCTLLFLCCQVQQHLVCFR